MDIFLNNCVCVCFYFLFFQKNNCGYKRIMGRTYQMLKTCQQTTLTNQDRLDQIQRSTFNRSSLQLNLPRFTPLLTPNN